MEDKLEKFALLIFEECKKENEPVTMEEAREMALMEIKAKNVGRHYEKSIDSPKKARKPKPRKIDEQKLFLLSAIMETLNKNGIDEVTRETETALHFNFKGENYSLKLTKHRNK